MAKNDAKSDQVFALFPKTGRGTGFSERKERCSQGRLWRETTGYVETPHGFVQARSHYYERGQRRQRGYKGSCLTIIKAGKSYHRFFDKEYSARGLVTKAKKFANEVFGKQ